MSSEKSLVLRPDGRALVAAPPRTQGPPLIGEILMETGDLSPGDMAKAAAIRVHKDVRFGEILVANNMVSERALYRALARQFRCDLADLASPSPDIRLLDTIGPELCLRHGIIPWKRIGAVTLIATSRPQNFAALAPLLPDEFGQTLMVLASENDIHNALLKTSQQRLARRAETRVIRGQSCRNWASPALARKALVIVLALVALVVLAPRFALLFFTGWAVTALVFNTALKIATAWTTLWSSRHEPARFASSRSHLPMMQLPKISILVPLFREREIADRLVRRLDRLNYPPELLDICLIVEQDDTLTQAALTAAKLSNSMRQIEVPRAHLRTKPRALNYALDFCKGTIIGVYDAEDAPEVDQLHKVARRFHEAGPKTACLQGVLDFYNSRTNWLSRCFTIEYATWFRVVLPGLERLGLVIPLGGTTVFFRRNVLEEIGAWDAHNVTEDADLGVRLARRGYRTELIATLTEEEANCRIWPWIRQRSRWMKGYAMTWAVHMRHPRQLLADLGPLRFVGVQLVFLGSLSQFTLAPFLWTFWALPLGLPHPLASSLTPTAIYLLTWLFFTSEFVTLAVGVFALAPHRHRGLWLWVPSLHFYFPLAVIAAYKGIWELFSKPHYWDKTVHGQSYAKPGRRRSADFPLQSFIPDVWRRQS